MERKSSKENSVVFLVEGEEFKLRICLGGVGSAANSVGTMLKFTAFGAVLTPNLAELALSVFFFNFFLFCGGPNTFSQEKHPCLCQLSCNQ